MRLLASHRAEPGAADGAGVGRGEAADGAEPARGEGGRGGLRRQVGGVLVRVRVRRRVLLQQLGEALAEALAVVLGRSRLAAAGLLGGGRLLIAGVSVLEY